MAISVLDRKRRVLTQFAQAKPRAGTSSRPLDRSRRPPVCLQAGACFFAVMSASVKASDTCTTSKTLLYPNHACVHATQTVLSGHHCIKFEMNGSTFIPGLSLPQLYCRHLQNAEARQKCGRAFQYGEHKLMCQAYLQHPEINVQWSQ